MEGEENGPQGIIVMESIHTWFRVLMAWTSAGLYGGSLPESGGLSGKCEGGSPFVACIFIVDGDTDAVTRGIWDGVVAVVIAVTDNVIAAVQLFVVLLIPLLDETCTNGSNGPKSSASLSMPPMKSARPVKNKATKKFYYTYA